MQERDTVDNRTVYLNKDLADLSLHEVGVCSRSCREDDRNNGWFLRPNYGEFEDVTSWKASSFPATHCPVSVL